MRYEDYDDLNVPGWALSGLVNGDWSGVDDPEDEEQAKSWLDGFGPGATLCVEDGDPFFTWSPEFGLAADCHACTVVVPMGSNGITHEQVAEIVRAAHSGYYPLKIRGYVDSDGAKWDYTVHTDGPGVYTRLLEEGLQVEPDPDLAEFPEYEIERQKLKDALVRSQDPVKKARAPVYTPYSDRPEHQCLGVSVKDPTVLYLHDLRLISKTPTNKLAAVKSDTQDQDPKHAIREHLRIGLYIHLLKLTQESYDRIQV